MRSAVARLLLIPLITATIVLTGCTPKTSLERHTGIMFMLQMMDLILTSTPRKQTPYV